MPRSTRVIRYASPGRRLLGMLWQQPLWAIPFALFFGTLFGGRPKEYVQSYWMALTFAYCVGLSIWAVRSFVLARIISEESQDRLKSIWTIGLWIAGASFVGAYVAAFIIQFKIMPGFLGSTRAVIVSGMYTLLFTLLFGGISFAMVFYRKAVERARAVEQIRAELAEAELRALRAQIHPHFLFNTLNSIAALIPQDPAAAEETTTLLAEVFRYTLQASNREYSRFGDELAFVRSYLGIERTRLGERLIIRENIEPGLESTSVPSMLLQPVVENAVIHGIAPRPEGGTLTLVARREGATLVIEIGDDGPGFRDAAPSGNGFGLRSVRERLLRAGPPHALEIRSTGGAGTRVCITLPLVPATKKVSPPPPGDPCR